jgi:hypothetical protein
VKALYARFINWLPEITNDAVLQNAGHDVFIRVGCHKDCRNRLARIDEAPVKLEACHHRHMHVCDQTGCLDKGTGGHALSVLPSHSANTVLSRIM